MDRMKAMVRAFRSPTVFTMMFLATVGIASSALAMSRTTRRCRWSGAPLAEAGITVGFFRPVRAVEAYAFSLPSFLLKEFPKMTGEEGREAQFDSLSGSRLPGSCPLHPLD